MSLIRGLGSGVLACGLALVAPVAAAAMNDDTAETRPALVIPKLDRAPTLEDFAGLRPSASIGDSMRKVEAFTQAEPTDGRVASKRTEAYLGYDGANVYVVFLAFDPDHGHVRARRVAREKTDGDDLVTVTLDTFDDARRRHERERHGVPRICERHRSLAPLRSALQGRGPDLRCAARLRAACGHPQHHAVRERAMAARVGTVHLDRSARLREPHLGP